MTHFIGTRKHDLSMVSIGNDNTGFIGGVLIGLRGEVKGLAPAIGWSDSDLMDRLEDMPGITLTEIVD